MPIPPALSEDDQRSAFFDHASSAFIIASENGRILATNQTLLDWLGYREEELVEKKSFPDLLSIGGKIYYNTHHRPNLELQGQIQEIAYDLIHKDQRRIPVLVNSRFYQPRQAQQKLIFFVVSSYFDRSQYEKELRLAKDKADQANKSKATFISNVSHEIRTPIHAIRSAADFLLRQHPRADQQEWLKILLDSSQSLIALVNDVLDLNKLDAGKITLVNNAFNLRKLLEDIFDNFRVQQTNDQLTLVMEIGEQVPTWVVGDSLKVRQVITNLLSNAIKFTKQGEVVLQVEHLGTSDDEVELWFRVSDTGIGLSPDNLERIFNPYVQANAEIEHDFGGTGLGLAICRGILQAYGTTLQVSSELNKGTVFSFRLKLIAATPAEQSAPKRSRPRSEFPKLPALRVLAVDDNLSNILILTRYLELWGLEYLSATDGLTALKLLEEQPFDLVLMDLRMPGLDGYETTKKIRVLPDQHQREIPVVAVSATPSSSLTEEMKKAGFNQLLLKPFEPADLYDLLRHYSKKMVEKKLNTEELPLKPVPVNFTSLVNLFEEDAVAIEHFLTAVEKDLEVAINDVRSIRFHDGIQETGAIRHKLKSIVQLFELEEITARINQVEEAQAAEDSAAFLSAVNNLLEGVQAIITEIRDYRLRLTK